MECASFPDQLTNIFGDSLPDENVTPGRLAPEQNLQMMHRRRKEA
jgi:hypothetical protein